MHVGSIQFRMLGLLAIGTICSLIACGGGGGGSSSSPSTVQSNTQPIAASVESVQITPGSLTLNAGAQTQFTVTVSGTTGYSPAVTWTAQSGTITSTGLYTAPANGASTDQVTATSVQTPSQSATATITVEPAAAATLAVDPPTATLAAGAQTQFSATAAGAGGSAEPVTWKARLGSITASGLYTAPATGGTDTVTAVSQADPTLTAASTVEVIVPVTVTSIQVSPSAITLNAGAQTTFAATLTGTGAYSAAVTWSAQRGTVTASGVYTAPATGGSDVVTATSVQTPADIATASIQVVVPAAVSSVAVSPTAVQVNAGSATQFSASVGGTGSFSQGVTWSAQRGTVTGAGLYTAPAAGGSDTVTATSVQNPSDSATAAITVVIPATVGSVTVSPATVQLNAGATTQFSATVSGTGSYSQSVTWSAQRGTITGAGLYTAPAAGGSDVVTATSVETPSDSASSSITVVVPATVSSVAVSPSSLQVNAGGSAQVSATVAGTGSYSSAVTWSALRGTVTGTGLYTAPATGGADTITAASVQTPGDTATVQVTVVVPAAVTAVTVSPAAQTLNAGAQATFTATVVGTGSYSSAVTWSAQLGTITGAGLYTAPAAGGSDVVTATSVQSPAVSGTANITAVIPVMVTSVSVSPATTVLNASAQSNFSAAVQGVGGFSQAVAWSAQRGSITSAGVYTAPATGGSDVVTAKSVQTPTVLATAAVTVVAPATVSSVTVSPATLSMAAGAQTAFTATVAGTGSYSSAVTWAAQLGTITSAGVYTAPAGGGSDVVTATSVQNTGMSATASVTVTIPAVVTAVTVSPATVTVDAGTTSQFSVTVAGKGGYSSNVTWSAKLGTITPAGLYTPPATGTADVVTATSVQTPAVSASANVTLAASTAQAPATPVIAGPVEIQAGGGPYSASTTVPAGDNVQWTITGGSITSGATAATVEFQAGSGPYATLTCTVTNGGGSASASQAMIALPFAPRNYVADLKGYLNTYGADITADIATNNIATYYSDSYYLYGLAAAADATGDTTLMAACVGYAQQIMALAQPLVNNGVTTPQLGPLVSGVPQQAYTFFVGGVLARIAAVIKTNPAFSAYAPQAAQMVTFVQQSVFTYWFDKNTGAYSDPSSPYPCGCIPWCSTALGGWGSYAYFPNQVMLFGMCSAWMYQATGNALYLDAATRCGQQFKTSDLQVVNGYYLWDVGRYGFEAPDNTDGSQDTSHANRVPMMVQAMYENGIVFTAADMTMLAGGLLNSIWNQSEANPMFANYIDGGNTAYRAVTTPYGNGLVYHGWDVLGRNSLQAQRVLAITYNFMCTNPNLNASITANYSSYGLMEMSGLLARNISH